MRTLNDVKAEVSQMLMFVAGATSIMFFVTVREYFFQVALLLWLNALWFAVEKWEV